ncbi:purine-cytosine permease family protein [Brevibacterium sp. 1718]|uniref:purine-cytosine permease family protein n=1 Tax=Brevibacterium sp. 1718 TaxID=3413510 RepID=UPI003DA87FEA
MTAIPAPHPKFVEKRSIDYIPPSERHGRPISLLFVWFAANSSITALVTGALMTILGNSALWSIPAILLGNILGGYITALHSAQGPQLGVPQMIQSRAQFGFYGAILPLVLTIFIYIGFYATGLVLGGQALGLLFHVSPQIGAILFAVFCALSAIVGYRWIHQFSHLPAFLSAIVFVWLIVVMVTGDMGETIAASNGFAMAPFVLGVSLSASWQLTFGPYIADYSRYLPETTSQNATVGWTFLGSVLGASLAMTVGAFAAFLGGDAFSGSEVGYITDLAGKIGVIVLLAVILGKLAGNTLSAYGGFMSITTIVSAFTRQNHLKSYTRTLFILGVTVIALAIALAASEDFLTVFQNFLLFLLYFMTPWSAVNLVDFYLVRNKKYDIKGLFDPNGIYGKFNWIAYVAYLAGVFVQIPFMNSAIYVGPIAYLLNGAEIAWILGVVVSAVLYYLMTGELRRRIKGAAV